MSRSLLPTGIRWSTPIGCTRPETHRPLLWALRRPAADPLELWDSPPFEPKCANGNLYARGSADDKGQMYTHIKAIEALRGGHGTLPLNRQVPARRRRGGRRRFGAQYVEDNPEKLKADVALVSDTAMYEPGLPTLNVGLRGLLYMEIEAHGPLRDLHSGLYGGAAPNAVFGLIELLSKGKDADGQIKFRASTTTWNRHPRTSAQLDHAAL